MPGEGHNSAGEGHNSAGEELRSLVERVERLNEEKQGIADDIKDIFLEAKSRGWDTKVMRKIIAARKVDTEKRQEERALIETYASALGMDYV